MEVMVKEEDMVDMDQDKVVEGVKVVEDKVVEVVEVVADLI